MDRIHVESSSRLSLSLLQKKRVLVQGLLVIVAFYLGGFSGILTYRVWVKSPEPSQTKVELLENVTFSELRDSLLRLYSASRDDVTSETTKIKDALEAMKLVEKDGNPAPIENFPYLYVGGAGAAYNLDALLRANITDIVNLSPGTKCSFPQHFNYMHITEVSDKKGNSLRPYFNSTSHFIETARLKGGTVLVHCWTGGSRSVTVLIAYLMKYHDMERHDALSLIRKTRHIASPKEWFRKDLHKYEKILDGTEKRSKSNHNPKTHR